MLFYQSAKFHHFLHNYNMEYSKYYLKYMKTDPFSYRWLRNPSDDDLLTNRLTEKITHVRGGIAINNISWKSSIAEGDSLKSYTKIGLVFTSRSGTCSLPVNKRVTWILMILKKFCGFSNHVLLQQTRWCGRETWILICSWGTARLFSSKNPRRFN